MNNPSTISNIGNMPLKFFQPSNIIVFMSFFSPVILAICIIASSFVFQNVKGLVYLGFLIAACVLRDYTYMLNGANPTLNDRTICTSVQYSKYGNPSFSAFVFAFTICYMAVPMFTSGNVNYWVFSALLSYFFIDMFVKIYKNCVVKMSDLFINVLSGSVIGTIICVLMYLGKSGSYLFFNDEQDNNIIQPQSSQTFKCAVYKNGELISNI
jgi:hypothetical protein